MRLYLRSLRRRVRSTLGARTHLERDQLQRPQRPVRSGPGQPAQQQGVAQEVAGTQPRECKCLRDAPQNQHTVETITREALRLPRHDVGERLIHHDDATGTSQAGDRGAGVQHGRGIGGVAQHHQVGGVGHEIGVEVPGRREHHLFDRDVRCAQGALGLGERGLHKSRQPGLQLRQQRETLGGPGQQQHLGRVAAVMPGNGLHGPSLIVDPGIAGEVTDAGIQRSQQKVRGGTTHVDREVDKSGLDVTVAVTSKVREQLPRRNSVFSPGRCARRFHSCRAYGQDGLVSSRIDTSLPDPADLPDPAAASTVLLFDLDGTITDSFAGIEKSFRHALDTVGAPQPDESVVAGIAGPPMIDSLRRLDLDEPTVDAAMKAYRERYVSVGWLENSVFDGMDGLLADLSASGRRLAVATSKNQATARRILEHFGLDKHFEYIAGASDDGTRRSKSDVIGHALTSLGITDVSDHAVVMIGDRSHDVHGSAEYGIPAVFVRWGYAVSDEHTDAAWAVESVDQLRGLLHA